MKREGIDEMFPLAFPILFTLVNGVQTVGQKIINRGVL